MAAKQQGRRVNLWLRIFLPFAAGYYFSYFLRNVNAVIAPELTRELGVSAADLGLLTSAYLLAFGAVQLPLGLALDRWGARRVESTLLLIAAAGCALFAMGNSLTQLAVARALIGLGVSACLMASFKAFGQWFGLERQASLNAAIMAAGGLGAITASTPLSWAIPAFGWRAVFIGTGDCRRRRRRRHFQHAGKGQRRDGGAAAATGCRPGRRADQPRLLALCTAIDADHRRLHGLAGAVGGALADEFLRPDAGRCGAHHLLLMAGGMLTGFLGIAFGVNRVAKLGLGPERLLLGGMGLGLLATLLIVLGVGPSEPLWLALGLVFSVGNLAYALLQANYGPELAGRVNTALNLMVFIGAFGIQWGFGAAVDALRAAGQAPREAFQITFGGLLALQLASWLWYLADRRR
jgi:hypothetical protein